ncbi:MAG TPA: FecR domain-containing protein [Stellaceae bacterium]|nr:FecR domain-containing protein [Stellaceae bacterium]
MIAMSRRLGLLTALLAVLTLAVPGSPALAEEKVGVNSAVNPDANGTPPGATMRRLVLGQEVVHDERIATGPDGQAQILFLDESSLNVGPSSDITVDNFVYNPNTGTGQLAMSATRGVMRFVGGRLSKQENAVSMRTPSGIIGIRGGIFVMNLAKTSGQLDVVFLFGKGLTVTSDNLTQTITRPGFSVTVAAPGAAPSSPHPTPPQLLSAIFADLTGKNGKTAGSRNPPTERTVADSGIAKTISANVAASVRQATQNGLGSYQLPITNISTIQASQNTNSVSMQGDPTVAAAQQGGGNTQSGSANYPEVVQFYLTNDGVIHFAGITTAILNNGVLSNPSGGADGFGSFPLPVGYADFGPQNTTSCCGTLKGVSFLASDDSFLYAAFLTSGIPGQLNLLYTGFPTVNMPTSGSGSYSGNAVGGVYNNGSAYAATGTFNASYNFGNATGTFSLNNFDNQTLSGSIAGSVGTSSYSGSISNANLVGVVGGSFFGTNANTTGGLFSLVNQSGNTYRAFGVYGGMRH